MSKMSQPFFDFTDLQVVLDNEADFQQKVLPKLFSTEGELNRIDLRREIKSYVGKLLRKNWDVYSYLDASISGSNDEQQIIIEALAGHWEVKWKEGVYT
jgi:hypothetical protein